MDKPLSQREEYLRQMKVLSFVFVIIVEFEYLGKTKVDKPKGGIQETASKPEGRVPQAAGEGEGGEEGKEVKKKKKKENCVKLLNIFLLLLVHLLRV